MSKFLKLALLSFMSFVLMTFYSKAQLNQGEIGIGAMFSGVQSYATFHYALSSNMDISAGLVYISEKYDSDESTEPSDAETTLGLKAMLKYFLMKGKDVSPFVGGYINYISYPTEEGSTYEDKYSLLGIGGIFGAQAFLAKGFAVYGYAALGYEVKSFNRNFIGSQPDENATYTTISLTGSGVGAVFYFNF